MKISSLPFFLVFISSLIPMACSLFDIPSFHIAPGLVFFAWVINRISIRNGRTVVFCRQRTWVVVFILLLLIDLATARGFVILSAGGYALIFAFIFYNQLLTGAGASVIKIVRGISFLYKFYIVGMIIEAIIIILGKQPLLAKYLFSINGGNYKTYNSAEAAKFLGLFPANAGGLNSMLLGSQIAGMLSLFAVIWFVSFRKVKLQGTVIRYSNAWIALSLIILLLSTNVTVFLMLVLTVIIYHLFIKTNKPKQRFVFLIAMSLSIAGVYFLINQGFLFGRIFSADIPISAHDVRGFSNSQELIGITHLEFYLFMFLKPVYIWLSQNWLNMLIGVGAQFFRTTNLDIPGDFGFFVDVVLKAGLIWAIVFVMTMFAICLPSLRLTKRGSNIQQLWARLRSINALISILWLFSTVHYNQAMQNTAASMLFALHLALVIYCDRRYRASVRGFDGGSHSL